MINIFYLILFSPIFLIYLILCLTIPLIKFGKIEKAKGRKIHLIKDNIHCDYIIESKYLKSLFLTKKKYTKIGWGDRKIFLETQSWDKFKYINLFYAFFGLNDSVLRVEFLKQLPSIVTTIELNQKQLNILKKHIKNSHNKKVIKKKIDYYKKGTYYESSLKYNCVTNCNNWINQGLRLDKINNRLWCPLSFWL
jgi:uncharacterized protein (TIGR02117 family)